MQRSYSLPKDTHIHVHIPESSENEEAALDTQSENGIDYGNDDDDDDEDETTKPPSSKKASEEKSSNPKGESEASKKCDGKGCAVTAIADGKATEAPKATPRNEHSIYGHPHGSVTCGSHIAASCSRCPEYRALVGAWNRPQSDYCNGECEWRQIAVGVMGCAHKMPGTVSCGRHWAASCAQCPMGYGATWCNGQCYWYQGNCWPRYGVVQHTGVTPSGRRR